ncbi:MAG: electron transporter RnfD, partial [Candidatus Delongbacteria bacterium]|nr:electron transporter RnfD [Candidatus Delongbacteria bacterium]
YLFTWAMGYDPVFHILAGGLALGAFYMATDMVTSPISNKGNIIFAIGLAFFTVAIRICGGYPEGVSYSILLMNTVVPLINKFTVPKKFGYVKPVKAN